MNIHPGETADEVIANVKNFVVPIKKMISPGAPFAAGLRLSNKAADDLLSGDAMGRLVSLLHDEDIYVFTINGFVYGKFHKTRVKENVYLPDWLDRKRVSYTSKLIRILGKLLPAGVRGSISTSPFIYKEKMTSNTAKTAGRHFSGLAHTLYSLSKQNKDISIALEPEPACYPETIDETIEAFSQVFTEENIREFAKKNDLSAERAEAFMREHLGICYDTCHMAVEFETPDDALSRLNTARIKIQKIQLSSALSFRSGEARKTLLAFDEEIYLHQVTKKNGQRIARFSDIAPALASSGDEDTEWRVHFHVPIFMAPEEGPGTTQDHVSEIIMRAARNEEFDHLEVETYTWDVLPKNLRKEDVRDSILRELRWVIKIFETAGKKGG